MSNRENEGSEQLPAHEVVGYGRPPTRRRFDAGGFTSTPNEEVRLLVSGGDVFALVDSWRGGGEYELFITFE